MLTYDQKQLAQLIVYIVIIALSMFFSGCSSMPVVTTDNGTAITVETRDSVLAIMKQHPGSEKLITYGDDGYTVFIVEQETYSKPIIISASSSGEIAVLINQYTSDGFELMGGVSVAVSSFGKTSYHATFVRK